MPDQFSVARPNQKRGIEFTLTYEGRDSDRHEIDLYDVCQALIVLQRSLALTTHLVLNDEIITQSPSLKGAHIYALPADEGRWKLTATIIIGTATAFYSLSTAPKDTALGHLIYSAYDYVVSESLGVHVDYTKTLGQLYEESKRQGQNIPQLRQSQLDSLIEKCSTAIRDIHRPIYKTQTADSASIAAWIKNQFLQVGTDFTIQTFQYMATFQAGDTPELINGRVASYNANTYKGRIYVPAEGRPVPFELSNTARTDQTVKIIVTSLGLSALKHYESENGMVYCRVIKSKSKSGQLKGYLILEVSNRTLS